MGEFADVVGVIGGAGGADDVVGVGRVWFPEAGFGDVVGLADYFFGEAEGLEGFDATGLDAVSLAEFEAACPAFDDAGVDLGELGELGGGNHAGGAGADDEDVHGLW